MKGVVIMFDPARHFGFIRVEGVADNVYVNRRQIPGEVDLRVGQSVTFDIERTKRGMAACNVVLGRNRIPPKRAFSLAGLAIAALFAAGLVLVLGLHWLVSWLLAINVIGFIAYGWDKAGSSRGWFRIPEIALHLVALAGGFVGTAFGQWQFRHKTRKPIFKVVFALGAVLWAGLLWWYLSP